MKRNESLIPRNELVLYHDVDESNLSIAGLLRTKEQFELERDIDVPIFIVGPHASGKSAVAEEALDASRYNLFDTGPILRSYHTQDSRKTSFREWLNENENEYGKTFTDDILSIHILKSINLDTYGRTPAIIGNRSLQGVNVLTDALKAATRQLIYVTADERILRSRLQVRESRSIKLKKFSKLLQRDIDLGLQGLEVAADVVIDNGSDIKSAVVELQKTLVS